MTAPTQTVRSFIDGKLISQIDTWDGERSKLKMLKIQLHNYLGAMDPRMRELAEKAERWLKPIEMSELMPEEKLMSQALRFALGQILKKSALIDLVQMSRDNGFECWRTIWQRKNPITGTALRLKKLKIMNPEGSKDKNIPALENFHGDFYQRLAVWKTAVDSYETNSSEQISESDRISFCY